MRARIPRDKACRFWTRRVTIPGWIHRRWRSVDETAAVGDAANARPRRARRTAHRGSAGDARVRLRPGSSSSGHLRRGIAPRLLEPPVRCGHRLSDPRAHGRGVRATRAHTSARVGCTSRTSPTSSDAITWSTAPTSHKTSREISPRPHQAARRIGGFSLSSTRSELMSARRPAPVVVQRLRLRPQQVVNHRGGVALFGRQSSLAAEQRVMPVNVGQKIEQTGQLRGVHATKLHTAYTQ